MTEIPSYLNHPLTQFCLNICRTMRVSRWIKPPFIFYSFPKKISIMFRNSLATAIVPLKNCMSLRENTTYIKFFTFNGYNDRLISERWKFIIKENYENSSSLIIHDHHSIKVSRAVISDKLTSTEIYSILISKVQYKPSSNIYFENLFKDYNIEWTPIYILPRLVTCNTYMRSFQ